MISETDHQRIMAAVAEAEAKTSGDIICVLTGEVSKYREAPLGYAALLAIAGPPIAFALGLQPALLQDAITTGWTANVGAPSDLGLVAGVYAIAQAVIFGLGLLVFSFAPVRRFLTPTSLKKHRVHRAAWAQFAATGLHLEPGRTGVLIFASTEDRVVEVLAEEDIHKAVGTKVWDAAVAAVQSGMKAGKPADGFIKAVEICGAALAEHFPPGDGPKPSNLPDRLVEL